MKCRYYILLICVILGFAGNLTAQNTNLINDLNQLIGRINTKIETGKHREKEFTDELKGFDDLFVKYGSDKAGGPRVVLAMKYQLYLQVFYDQLNAANTLRLLKANFPEANTGGVIDKTIEEMQPGIEKQKTRNQWVEGARFPDFNEKDINGKPLSIASRKAKVVLIDFWATWCGPCRQEIPNELEVYKKYHDRGFDIIGVSLDEDRAELDKLLLAAGMNWPEFFDGQATENKLAVKYGIGPIPANYLLDGSGKIIDSNLRGDELEAAVAKALKQ